MERRKDGKWKHEYAFSESDSGYCMKLPHHVSRVTHLPRSSDMSIGQQMLDAASNCTQLLETDAINHVADFVSSRLSDNGGFKGRSDAPDLYYTVFGLDSLLALDRKLPSDRFQKYIAQFGTGEQLDLVHLACLARCASRLPATTDNSWNKTVAARVENCR
jgi:hypothetical protein